MMSQPQDTNRYNAPEWSFSFIQAGFWMSYCVSVSFAAVYLQALGYTNGQLGIILALGSVTGIIAATAASARIDGDETVTAKKVIPLILALQAAAAAVLLAIAVRCAAVSVAFVAYIGFCTALNSLNLKLYADAAHAGYRINYGFTRGIGSIAYVLTSMALGLLIEHVSIRVLPVLGLALCGVQAVAFVLFTRFVHEDRKAGPFAGRHASLAGFLKSNPRYSLFLAGVVLLFFGNSTACNFLINLTRHVGGGTTEMGFINAFKSIVEIPFLLFYTRFFRDGKHNLALRISAVAFVLKSLALLLSTRVWHLAAAFVLQAPSYALYMAAVVAYVKENIAYEDSAKAQSLAFTTTSLGSMLASLISGHLYDHLSVPATLAVALVIGAAGTVIVFLGLGKAKFQAPAA